MFSYTVPTESQQSLFFISGRSLDTFDKGNPNLKIEAAQSIEVNFVEA